jgi:hypothetical protein
MRKAYCPWSSDNMTKGEELEEEGEKENDTSLVYMASST